MYSTLKLHFESSDFSPFKLDATVSVHFMYTTLYTADLHVHAHIQRS